MQRAARVGYLSAYGSRAALHPLRRMIEITYTPLEYRPYQSLIYSDARHVLIEASTKVGKTVSCMDWQILQWLTGPAPGERFEKGKRYGRVATGRHLWCAQTYKTSKIAFERACKNDWLGAAISAGAIHKHEGGAGKLPHFRLPDGRVWMFASSDNPSNLYGDEIDSCVMDEYSRHKESAFDALNTLCGPTLAPMRLIGNVYRKSGWGYRLARKVEECVKQRRGVYREWEFAKITAWDAARDPGAHWITKAEIEQTRAEYEERGALHIFRRDYEADPEGTGQAFGQTDRDACELAPRVPDGRTALLIDQGGRRNPAGLVVVRVGAEGEAELISAERWFGSPVDLWNRVQEIANEHAIRAVAFDSYDPSFVDMCKRTWRRRAVQVGDRKAFDNYQSIKAMMSGRKLHIPYGDATADLWEDLEAVSFEEDRLIFPEFNIRAVIDGESVERPSHCDLASALLRLPPVVGILQRRRNTQRRERRQTQRANTAGRSAIHDIF